jgi:hypothetical protein
MKKVLLLWSFCSLTAMTAFAQSETKTAPTAANTKATNHCHKGQGHANGEGRGEHKAQHEAMLREVGLTPEEGKKVQAIGKDTRTQICSLRDDKSLTQAQRKEKIKALRQATHERVTQAVGQEKAAKLLELREKMHRNHHGDKGDNKAQPDDVQDKYNPNEGN